MHASRAAALLALTVGTACAHAPRPAIARPAAERRCDDALAVLLERPTPRPAGDELRQAVTAPLSWLAVGAGYTADVVVLAAGAAGGGLCVCMPVLVLEGALGGSGDLSSDCMGSVASAIWRDAGLPGAGSGLARATRRWRCPDLSRRAAEAQAVAGCLAERNGPGDLETARSLLAPLTEQRLDRCLPARDRTRIARALRRLEERDRGPEEGSTPDPSQPPEPDLPDPGPPPWLDAEQAPSSGPARYPAP